MAKRMRTPSIKKSISARTTGKATRAVKKAINPTYGKKGMGIINDPKKAMYNKVYNQTTTSAFKSSSSAKANKTDSTSYTSPHYISPKSPKSKKKKKWPYILLAILVLGGIGSMNKEDSTKNSVGTSNPASSSEEVVTTTPIATPEPNTTETLDSITVKAKEDAEGHLDLSTCKQALEFLKDNYPDYFTDNETMEKVMYYGAFLEYSFEGKGINDTCATLGQDVLQAVKYVYRGVDTIEDDATQENLRQVAASLEVASLD